MDHTDSENLVEPPSSSEPDQTIRMEDTDSPLPKHWKSGSLKYDDFKPLAEGGSAAIQSCLDKNLHRVVAYKSLHPHMLDSEMEIARFTREARVTAMISHPGTVPVYEMGRDRAGNLYFTMKKLEGRDLRSILLDIAAKNAKAKQEYPVSRLIDILIQASQTVSFAHAQGVIHRDLKPANILVGGFGEVMVLDWGLAKVRGEKDPEGDSKATGHQAVAMELTQPGQRYGTPLYMSPEQAVADAEIDERTDVYNLGSILYEVLTHKNLVWGTSVEEVLEQIRNHPTPIPSDVAPDLNIPKELEAICLKALAKNPLERYPSVKAMAEDLQRYRDGLPVSVCQDPWSNLRRWALRHALFLASVGSALGGVLLGWLMFKTP